MVPDSNEIHLAADALGKGQLVAFPTETVYGLGADAENPDAVAAIYALKGRPSGHPLIVHLAPGADIAYWAEAIPEEARKLIDAFWPGPLTLILKRAAHIPSAVAGGQDTIGLRCPSHPVAQALLLTFKAGKGGVAAPSANLFGHVSPTLARHVRDEFGNDPRLAVVLDGGQSEVGIESTILDLSRIDTHGPVLLRPGKISATDIAHVTGRIPAKADSAAPRASGTLLSHYAPDTPVVLVATSQMAEVFS
ncbi:MAG: threonylcarbamoyl-AMP synthase, partial [Oxalobacter sp.]|nr:threonylcarbamoyl-AMP synthase [Oxalobacter sp.]